MLGDKEESSSVTMKKVCRLNGGDSGKKGEEKGWEFGIFVCFLYRVDKKVKTLGVATHNLQF